MFHEAKNIKSKDLHFQLYIFVLSIIFYEKIIIIEQHTLIKMKTDLIWQKKKVTTLWFPPPHTSENLLIFKIPKTVVAALLAFLFTFTKIVI